MNFGKKKDHPPIRLRVVLREYPGSSRPWGYTLYLVHIDEDGSTSIDRNRKKEDADAGRTKRQAMRKAKKAAKEIATRKRLGLTEEYDLEI